MPRTTSPRPAPAPARRRASRRNDSGGTLIGVFIGLVLGLGLAAGVAYYLMKANGPFPAQSGAKEPHDMVREGPKAAKADAASDKPRFDFYKILPGVEEPKVAADARKSGDRTVAEKAKERGSDKAGDKTTDKFAAKTGEKMGEQAGEKSASKVPDKVAATESTTAAKLPERFWLQAGSFAAETDAENLKARLAFAGWQASVQQGTLPDKGIRYRVRLGPYDNTDELNRIRGELAKNGFDVAVIKF